MDERPLRAGVQDLEAVAVPDPAFVARLHVRLLSEAGFIATTAGAQEGVLPPAASIRGAAPARVPDPRVPAWHQTGPLRLLGAAATLLLGLALVAGMLVAGAALRPPATPSPPSSPIAGLPAFSMVRTGSLADRGGRCGAAAVRLADGRVLIAGGWTLRAADLDSPAPSAVSAPSAPRFTLARTAEVYDPRSGTFAPAPGEVALGDGASATLLSDGRVLLAGGRSISSQRPEPCGSTMLSAYRSVDTAYLFDPATATITQAGSLVTPRAGHVAVLLPDGQVLLAGGSNPSRAGTDDAIAAAELFDPSTGTFSATGSMTVPRGWGRALGSQWGPWATLLGDGRVLLSGGSSDGIPGDVLDLFDPATGTFTAVTSVLPPDVLPEWVITGTSCFGLCGARTNADGTWGEVTRITSARVEGGFGVALLDDPALGHRLYIAGGDGASVLDLDTGEVREAPFIDAMGYRRMPSVTVLEDGSLLIAGGIGYRDSGESVLLSGAELFVPAS